MKPLIWISFSTGALNSLSNSSYNFQIQWYWKHRSWSHLLITRKRMWIYTPKNEPASLFSNRKQLKKQLNPSPFPQMEGDNRLFSLKHRKTRTKTEERGIKSKHISTGNPNSNIIFKLIPISWEQAHAATVWKKWWWGMKGLDKQFLLQLD